MEDGRIAELVRLASGGDSVAWEQLVAHFAGLVWAVTRAHRLSSSDASEVSQTTWLRLVEHIDRIHQPDRVGAWLAITARHECLRVIRQAARQVPVGDNADAEEWADLGPGPDAEMLLSERSEGLWRAFDRLPEGCRRLLRVLMVQPRPSYEEVAGALDIPIGSIGPTRARCLARLRRSSEVARIQGAAGSS